MDNYQPPIDDLRFAIRTHGVLDEVLALPGNEELDPDTVDSILEEAGKFAADLWGQSNEIGDKDGAKFKDGKVLTNDKLREAYQAFCEAGWISLHAPLEFGGQNLPHIVSAACDELWDSGNLALSLLPMLSNGAMASIARHGDEHLKNLVLEKMVTGEWSGTMNLTEPQAGSDLSFVATKAVPEGDHYLISGQKIFITWGDHDLCDNIIHLVLARLPDAPAGSRGISLFVVPKFHLEGDNVGEFNNVNCVSIEHKMGIHGSPTCVMEFDKSKGYIIGEPNKGLRYMFTMMNHARLNVGIEGHAVAERAFQHAREYAIQRIQSIDVAKKSDKAVPIIQHPDVRRMLLVQKTTLQAQRAMYLMTASLLDKAAHHPNPDEAAQCQRMAEFMVPIIKAFCTENGVTLTNLALQCFGGMGYIEETGASQFVRDVRITPIYEGTNGIQALDLLGRKTNADKGATAGLFMKRIERYAEQLEELMPVEALQIQKGLITVKHCIQGLIALFNAHEIEKAAAGSIPYLMMMGTMIGAGEMAKACMYAKRALNDPDNAMLSPDFYRRKIETAKVYFDYVLPQVNSYTTRILEGADAILSIDPYEI